MVEPIYDTPEAALAATDEFYHNQAGFQYSEEYVTNWLQRHIPLPQQGRVLDLCCGDGIWSKGLQNLNPALELFGIDISAGAIAKARLILKTNEDHFVLGDAEADLPFPDSFFNLIFARGPGLYNQHSMDRPATIAVIEAWHTRLTPEGLFYSIFASDPKQMGGYTPMDQVKLPYNRAARRTETVDFRGGKYHHTTESFLAPFQKAKNVSIVRYSFFSNLHFLVTQQNHR
jgi:SAM-dependent methyltransferase